MITGKVVNGEALIEIEISGPAQSARRSEAIIDTGFNGELTLPDSLISALQLAFAAHRRGALADGSIVLLESIWPRSSGKDIPRVCWPQRQQGCP